MPDSARVIGVDVGGTFTDIAYFDELSGEFRTAKVASNRGDEALGFLDGLNMIGMAGEAGAIIHGTTVGINALLERKGARVGLITTAGFRDVIEMRRRDRRYTWGLWGDFEPIVDRDMRFEVAERTLADGSIRQSIDLQQVREATVRLLERGAQALAIVFINAHVNPSNEQAALAVAKALWPNEHVACSTQILSEIREFERSSTAVLNAYLQPAVGNYLGKLETALLQQGSRSTLHVVQSNGGVMSTQTARRLPIRTALSGPAAGVIAAAAIAQAAGFRNVVTADLGGTSFDVSIVANGQAARIMQASVDFGLTFRTPMVEISTIGAGGGSIAKVDKGGLITVGPESAGSVPGPACYGKGNTRPTLTDANLVLGRINPRRPIGGNMASFDLQAARTAIEQHIGSPLRLDLMEAAEAVLRVANAKMAGAIRLVSIERGHDPSKFAIVSFGGGGALHVGATLKDVGLQSAIVPLYPGITSALGCIIADVRHDAVQTLNVDLDGLDIDSFNSRLRQLSREMRKVVNDSGIRIDKTETVVELDMHYLGQSHAISVSIAPDVGEVSLGDIRAAFDGAYSSTFGRLLPDHLIRVLSLRVAAVGKRSGFDLSGLASVQTSLAKAEIDERPVWFDGGWKTTRIFDRLSLPCGTTLRGPAIFEQPDATTVLDPDLSATVDGLGNLIINRG